MNCLVACVVWIGGYGYNDQCPAKVEVLYSTSRFHYVKILQGPMIIGDKPRLEINIWQKVAKPDCSVEKK